MTKLIYLIGVLLVVFVLGIGGTSWWYVQDISNIYRTESRKIATDFGDLEIKLQAVIGIYETQQSARLDTSKERVRVLGAATSEQPIRRSIKEQVGQVLGLEDSPQLQLQREIEEGLNQTIEQLNIVREKNNAIKNANIIPELTLMAKLSAPTRETDEMVEGLQVILSVLKKETALTIRAHSTGYELGLALETAVEKFDEESIAKLEEKIQTLRTLVSEEKRLLNENIPNELKNLLEKSVALSNTQLKIFEALPLQLRNKDLKGLSDNLKSLVASSTMDGNTMQVELVSFLKNDKSIRSVSTVRESWRKVYQ